MSANRWSLQVKDADVPRSTDAERAVLGSVLINNNALWRVVPIVSTADFFSEAHKTIYAAMQRLADHSVEIDLFTLKNELERDGDLEKVGGSAYVSSLVDGIPDVANVERYARMVLDKSMLRRLLVEGNRLMHESLEPAETPAEIAASSALRLTDLATTRDSGPIPVGVTAKRAAQDTEARSATGDDITGLPFGIRNIDVYTLGIQREVESVLAARPRVGKTTMALAVALHNAKRGKRTLFIQLDMSEMMIGKRLLSIESGVLYDKVRSGNYLSAEEWKRISAAQARLEELNRFMIFDYSTADLPKIAALVRREARTGLDLVIVDHIGHIAGGAGEKRYLQLGDVSRRFILLAKEAHCGWLSLVQLSRESEQREPFLSDLRESGNLEQDARLVVLLDRPWLRRENGASECLMRVHVPKNEGEAGQKFDIHFDGDVQRVSEHPTRRCRYCQNGETQ